jgi:peptidoglycan/xylan/chitin deacetylase (PgdA/CDA1 family)
MRLIISFLLLISTISGVTGNNLGQKTKIVFRFDDYRLESEIIYDSLLYVFGRNKIPLCLGIIPYNKEGLIYNNLNEEQLNDLKERIRRNEIEIALHGFNHNDNELIKRSLLNKPGPSEFSNLNYNDQFIKIKKGKAALDSLLNINVNIFIPPYNSYDENTLKALDSLKFKIISASIDGPSSSVKISYIPQTINDLAELPDIIKSIRNDNLTIIVVVHPYSIKSESNSKPSKKIYFNQLDTLLSWINNQNYIIATNFSMLDKSEIYDNERFVLNSINNNMLIKILNKSKIYRYGIYNTTKYMRNHKSIFGISNIFFHVIVFLCIYFATKIITKMIKSFKALRFIFLAILVIMIIFILYKGINSDSLVIYVILIATISLAFFVEIIRGNQISKKVGNDA